MFNRVAFWICNILGSFMIVNSFTKFLLDLDIVMKWSVTNHLQKYLFGLPLWVRIIVIIINAIIWIVLCKGWWSYFHLKTQEW